jgi:pilus assembly protein Flp/PilA
MQDLVLKVIVKMQGLKDQLVEGLIKDQSGQDLMEYALVCALIAMAATATMKSLATTIGSAFTAVGTKLTTYTS